MRRHSPHRQKQPECLRMLVFVALPAKRSRRSSSSTHTTSSFPQVRRPSTTGPPGSGPRRAVVVINSRIVARLDRKRLGAQYWGKAESRSEAFSMSRLEGSRWRLRRAREMPLAMEFEWAFLRFLFGAKRECRHFQSCGEEKQIPPHTWRIISRAASAAPAASLCAGHAQ